METLEYTVIKNKTQYNNYCIELIKLVDNPHKSNNDKDRIELLSLLIRAWDEDHNTFVDLDPVQLLEALMIENNLKIMDIVQIIGGNSKGLVSDILNYKKAFSLNTIRKLSEYFKLSQEAFSRPYELKVTSNIQSNSTKRVNTQKVTHISLTRNKKLQITKSK